MLLSLTEQGLLETQVTVTYRLTVVCGHKHYAPLSHDQVDCTLFTETRDQTHTHKPCGQPSFCGPEWSAHIIPKQRSWRATAGANAPQVHICLRWVKERAHMRVFACVKCFFFILSVFFSHTRAHTHTHINGNLIQRYCCPVQGHLPTRPVSLTGR